MKNLFLIFSAVLLLSGLCGCQTFRETFSRTPESMKRTTQRKSAPPPRRPGETGDKLFDTVFQRGKQNKNSYFYSETLNDQERRIVEQSFSRSANDDVDIQRIRERNNRSRIRQQDDVFGTHNGSFIR